MFAITSHKGFHMRFPNGYIVSVQFGPGNYCQNRSDLFPTPELLDFYECGDAEVAVIRPDGTLVPLADTDTVAGYQTPRDVARIIALAAVNPEQLARPRAA